MVSKPEIYFSEEESNVVGLRIGRGEIMQATPAEIRATVFQEGFDICRIKIGINASNVFAFLNDIGFYYEINSLLFRNKMEVEEKVSVLNNQSENPFSFEELEMHNAHYLEKLVRETLMEETGVVFYSWLQNSLVSQQQLVDSTVRYALSFAKKRDGFMGWFIKKDGQYIGYNLGRRKGDVFEGILIGVLPYYRKIGAASYVYNYFLNRVFPQMGVREFYNDVQIQNTPSIKSSLVGGLKISENYATINLFPLLSYKNKFTIQTIVKENDSTRDMGGKSWIERWYSVGKSEHKELTHSAVVRRVTRIENGDNAFSVIVYSDDSGEIFLSQYHIK